MSRLIDADELERRIREAETIFYDSEDVGIAIDCVDATKTVQAWHYPSKGEYPKDDEDVLICFYGLTSFKVGWYDNSDQSWCCGNCVYYKEGADNIIAWQYIEPPKEEV